MKIEDIATWGARAARWGADYLDTLRKHPVRAQTEPGDILKQLPDAPPLQAEEMDRIFADFEKIVTPGLTHWQHPRFFAYFPANSSPPSVIAEYLTATIAAQCMLWQTSPAATEIETRMMEWLRQMTGLPDAFHGVIQDSASTATLAALLTARERALGFKGNGQGLAGHPVLRVYCSEQCHSSIDKACRIAGIGEDNLVKLPVSGPRLSVDSSALQRAIDADLARGFKPMAIVACVGGTSTGAADDVREICRIAGTHGLYVHVDAAWAGSAMICPEFRELWTGADQADSVVFNPHKWLMTNFDCTAHFIREPDALVRTLGIRPAYLQTHGRDGIINYNEWSVPLGRRFRALKLWFVIRSYGVEGLQQIIRNHVKWSRGICERLRAVPGFEITSEPILSIFTFRHRPQGESDLDAHNARLIQAINDDGRIYLTPTVLNGRTVIRFQVGQTYTTEADVDAAYDVITEVARRLADQGSPGTP
jgi:aromatic-L-amino-acid decarboxylase